MRGSRLKRTINEYYLKLMARYGPQNWWPADDAFEIIVGAILTQNTSWKNVEKAISNLKRAGLMDPGKMHSLTCEELAGHIRPSGYYNIKARRLKAFLYYLFYRYSGKLDEMFNVNNNVLRKELIGINGIGPETADSILLYAGGQPVFVVDAYTKRVLSRHKIISEGADYREVQEIFMSCLDHNERLFNEYHALIVRVGKEFCRPREAMCAECPLG